MEKRLTHIVDDGATKKGSVSVCSILKKEFYFVRHGQTDHNGSKDEKVDLPAHIALNSTGLTQAKGIESLIASLPIKTVCCSPFKRAQETKDIITSRLFVHHCEIEELGECSTLIWKEMTNLGARAYFEANDSVRNFMDRVLKGINQALSQQGPVLIVAHGGIHWAICCFLGLNCEWAIDNCVPVHFTVENDQWSARRYI